MDITWASHACMDITWASHACMDITWASHACMDIIWHTECHVWHFSNCCWAAAWHECLQYSTACLLDLWCHGLCCPPPPPSPRSVLEAPVMLMLWHIDLHALQLSVQRGNLKTLFPKQPAFVRFDTQRKAVWQSWLLTSLLCVISFVLHVIPDKHSIWASNQPFHVFSDILNNSRMYQHP